MTPDVNVILVDFPNGGNEMVVPNEDGSYTLLINARLSYDGQLKAYEHGIRHIENNDFEKENVQEIEFHAHLHSKVFDPEPAHSYLDRIKRLRAERKSIQRQIKIEQKRTKFIMENYDMYKLAEHQYLYGKDL